MTSNIVSLSSERIARRKEQIADRLRAEGSNEETISRLATDDLAAQMIDHEQNAVASIFHACFPGLFRGGKELG
jgi:hypothetical protein